MTTTTTHRDDVRHMIGFQSDKATAANAALWSGQEALQEARESWAMVKEEYGDTNVCGPGEQIARRLAVRLEQRAGKTLGLVSSSACGLWGLADNERIFEVDSTDGGSDYLRGVRFVQVATLQGMRGYTPTMERYSDEFPVQNVVAFFDSYAEAHNFRISSRRASS